MIKYNLMNVTAC